MPSIKLHRSVRAPVAEARWQEGCVSPWAACCPRQSEAACLWEQLGYKTGAQTQQQTVPPAVNGRPEFDARQERAAELAVQRVRFFRWGREPLLQHDDAESVHTLGHAAALEIVIANGPKRLPD